MSTLANDEECVECSVTLSIELPESLSYISHLRRKIRFVIEGFGVSSQDADDIEVIIGELATNAVRHARGGDYKVAIELSSVQAIILVIDKGIGFLPEEISDPGTERADDFSEDSSLRIGGFGLLLVQSLSDNVQITRNAITGMTVRAVKNLQPKL